MRLARSMTISMLTVLASADSGKRSLTYDRLRCAEEDQVKERPTLSDTLPIVLVDQSAIFRRLQIARRKACYLRLMDICDSSAAQAVAKVQRIGQYVRNHDTLQYAEQIERLDVGAAGSEAAAALGLPVIEDVRERSRSSSSRQGLSWRHAAAGRWLRSSISSRLPPRSPACAQASSGRRSVLIRGASGTALDVRFTSPIR